ncbi:MAG: polysaccharide deacetylase family protein [Proteobacteria bacterium]|nr:polysaccharide deacetylase family protein [Pseudomonadota bacterium]
MKDIQAWLYVSSASQAHLMTLGADPTTGTRVWENYLQQAELSFARISDPADLTRIEPSGVLILASTVVLSDAEKQAVWRWRERGGSVLSTWQTGTYAPSGEPLGYGFMRETLDVEVAGDTQDEPDDTFMMVHGDQPVAHSLPAGTRVWLERVPRQLPLRLVGKQEAAQIMDWSRTVNARKPAGLIAYHERRMPSGRSSRVVTVGYPEQNWQRSDPRQLKAITGDILAWLLRRPGAYLGAWPAPYTNALLLALQAAEPVSETDVALARIFRGLGGRLTCYVQGANAGRSAPGVRKLLDQGHEIGYLGDTFEAFKDQPVARQAERLDKMQALMTEAGVPVRAPAGFAPPLDAYDATTRRLVRERGFDTYLSFMEMTEARLPFFAEGVGRDGTVVLPRSLIGPEEALEEDDSTGLDNFLAALELSARMGSLSVVRLPTQSLLVAEQLKRVLDKIGSLGPGTWLASASQLAQWWRAQTRVAVRLTPHPQGQMLSAEVGQGFASTKPVAIWIDLPQSHSKARLQALDNGSRPPPLIVVAPGRALISWRAPAAGTHRWLLSIED